MNLALLLLTSSWLPPAGVPLPPFEDPGTAVASVPVCAMTKSGFIVIWEDHQGLARHILARRREPGTKADWNNAVLIDTDTQAHAYEPRVAVAGDCVFAAWQEESLGTEAYFRRSTDDGKTWGAAPVRLPAAHEGLGSASMITIAGNASGVTLAVWEDRRSGTSDIFVRRSTDFGATWAPSDARLDSDGPNGAQPSYHPQLILQENGNAHVVWWDEAFGLSDVHVRSSTDQGATWKEIVRLDPGSAGEHASRDVCVASRGEVLGVAWEDEVDGLEREVVARMSTDSGQNWSSEVRMGRPKWAGSIEDPRIAIDGQGRAHVIWTAVPAEEKPHAQSSSIAPRPVTRTDSSPALFHAAIDSQGKILDPIAVPAATPHSSLAWIGSSDHVLWMVWVGTPVDVGAIEAASSTDFGKTWRASGLQRAQTPQGLYVPVPSFTASVDTSGALHLAWVEGRPERERLRFVRLEPSKTTGQ
jgi:hypothetical protein